MLELLIVIAVLGILGLVGVNNKIQKNRQGYPIAPDKERPSKRQVENFNAEMRRASMNRKDRQARKIDGEAITSHPAFRKLQEGFNALQQKFARQPQENIYGDNFGTTNIDPRDAEGIFANAFPSFKPYVDTIYRDPMGAQAGQPVNFPHVMGQAIQPMVDAFNQTKGNFASKYTAWCASPQQKTLTTSIWDIPLWAIEGVRDVDEGAYPLASLMPRVATSRTQIGATPRTARGAWTHLAESDETYNYTDDVYHGGTIANYTYDVVGYHRGIKTSALMALTGPTIENPRSSNAVSLLLSGRAFEETQIFQGRNGGNANSFKGIYEFSQLAGSYNESGATGMKYPNTPRLMFNTLRSRGAKKRTTIGASDINTITNIANALQKFVVTGSPYKNFTIDAPEMGLGLDLPYVDIDGHMIFESDGAPTASGSREIVGLDLKMNSMYMVQDITVHPLSKQGPVDKVGADAFGCMVSEGHPTIGRIHSIT